MAKAKGIHAHKFFKLGKAAAKKDKRNLMFATVLKAAPALPDRKSTRLNSSHIQKSRMPSSA